MTVSTVPGPDSDDGGETSTYWMVDGEVVSGEGTVPRLGGVQRRDVIAPWLRSRELLVEAVRGVLGRAGRTVAFHGVRVPLYGFRLVATAPRGVARVLRWWRPWVADADYEQDRAAAVATGRADLSRLREGHDLRRRSRRRATGLVVTAGLVGVVAGVAWWPVQFVAVFVVGLVLVAGWFGRPLRATPIVERVAYGAHRVPAFTEGLMMTALRDCGGEPKEARTMQIIQPPAKTRTGWEAVVVLGVDAEIILKARRQFASIIGRPANCIWLSTDPDESAGWLRIVVTRKSLRHMRVPRSPLLDPGFRFDYFTDSVPVGIDELGAPVLAAKACTSSVYGGIMGSGKTVSMLNSALAQACDPRVELHLFDGKGGTDWEELGRIAHFYRAGSDLEDFQALETDLRSLVKRMETRFRTLRDLPDHLKTPKTNSDLADRRQFDLHPVMLIFDETQEAFQFAPNAKILTELLTRLVKRGRAVAIVVEAGTQEISKTTLPFADMAAWQSCGMVRSHRQVDQILGTGSYALGYHADKFTPADVGIAYFGAGKEKSICKAYHVDPDKGEMTALIDRLYTDRQKRGLLTGMAAGDIEPDDNTESIVGRVLRLWPNGETALQWVQLVDILHTEMPGDYPEVPDLAGGIPDPVTKAATALSAQLARHGVGSRDVRSRFFPLTGQTSSVRKGVTLDDLATAMTKDADRTPDTDTWTPELTGVEPVNLNATDTDVDIDDTVEEGAA